MRVNCIFFLVLHLICLLHSSDFIDMKNSSIRIIQNLFHFISRLFIITRCKVYRDVSYSFCIYMYNVCMCSNKIQDMLFIYAYYFLFNVYFFLFSDCLFNKQKNNDVRYELYSNDKILRQISNMCLFFFSKTWMKIS